MSECTAMLLPTYVAPKYKSWRDCYVCQWHQWIDPDPDDDEDEYGCPLCDEGHAIEWAIAEFARQNNIERGDEDDR